jgi:serine/threonine protein kinase
MKILSLIFHTSIMNLKYAFQDEENLYMVSEFLKGGDLEYHLYKRNVQYTEK